MLEPKTREEMIAEMNHRIYRNINGVIYKFATLEDDEVVIEELRKHDTCSDVWYEMAERAIKWKYPADHETIVADLFTIAKLVMNRNAYEDGLPFCPLCGKLGLT